MLRYLVTPRHILGSDSEVIWAQDLADAKRKASVWAKQSETTEYELYQFLEVIQVQ